MPLTAYALLCISEKKWHRTSGQFFTFLAEEEQGSLSWQKVNRDFIGIDKIYDYFKNLFRDNTDLPQIHNEWMKAEYAISISVRGSEIRILKDDRDYPHDS